MSAPPFANASTQIFPTVGHVSQPAAQPGRRQRYVPRARILSKTPNPSARTYLSFACLPPQSTWGRGHIRRRCWFADRRRRCGPESHNGPEVPAQGALGSGRRKGSPKGAYGLDKPPERVFRSSRGDARRDSRVRPDAFVKSQIALCVSRFCPSSAMLSDGGRKSCYAPRRARSWSCSICLPLRISFSK